MNKILTIIGRLFLAGVILFTLWLGWHIISYQTSVYDFQNSTYQSLDIFRVVDNEGNTVAMQRRTDFNPGDSAAIGGIESGIPDHLIITSGHANQVSQQKLEVRKQLPWSVWFRMTFIPWRYRIEYVVNVLPDNQARLSWVLSKNTNKLWTIECGGWLVDRYQVDVIDRFKNVKFSVEHPREAFICNPLSYTGFERRRIESELNKK